MYQLLRTLLLIVVVIPLSLRGQYFSRCSAVYMDSIRHAHNPQLPNRQEFERWLKPKMQAMANATQTREVITIPVIVHIVHDNESVGIGRNISQAQVQSQIDVLNEDFRRELGTAGYNNHPAGADVEIEFCLATVDTNGNVLPEPGIDRINRQDFGNWPALPWSLNTVETFVMPFTIWNTAEYMNIYVVDLSGNNLGFAQFPDTDSLQGVPNDGGASTDGVTINYTNFGRIGNVQAPYDGGRTTTHEVGHWLGLLHIWGDGDCSDDDYCNDTPSADSGNFGCPTNASSCGSIDMVANYMDYSDDSCMNIFTNCQALRMRTIMAYSPRRASLVNSPACSAQVPPSTDFSANFTTVCEGSTVGFQDLSNNATAWNWTFENGNPATSTDQNPQVVYTTAGTYKVSLEASNAFGNTPLIRDNYITVTTSGLSTFFSEDFESGLGNFEIVNPDNSITWERKAVGGSPNGSVGLWINLYDYTVTGQVDEVISPVLDLSAQSSVQLTFDHAYRPFSDSEFDSLYVYASKDGGNSWPFLLASYGENGNGSFATGPEFVSKFIPANAEDWCFAGSGWSSCKTINLSDFDGETNFRFKFVAVNDYGNCITIDNIELAGVCSPIANIEPPLLPGTDFRIFPNPSQGNVWIELKSGQGQLAQIKLLNMLGQPIYQQEQQLIQGNNRFELDLSRYPAGTYVVELSFGERRGYERIILQP
ncbi:MAG: M43 family zinc metalloprotease [Bacteroidota bacterium]